MYKSMNNENKTIYYVVNQYKVLEILAANSEHPYPQVVPVNFFADQLQLTVQETRLLVKRMHGFGICESDDEGHYSLITLKGMNWLNKITYH